MTDSPNSFNYRPRSALTILSLEALTAGAKPPINPMISANINDEINISELKANEKESSENELKFSVEIEKNCKNEAKNKPKKAPIIAMIIDSNKKEDNILLLANPSERRVPISTVLFATAAYIVIAAPIVAPKLNIIVIKVPSMEINCERN